MIYIVLVALLAGMMTVTRIQAQRPSAGLKSAQIVLLCLTTAMLGLLGVRSCGTPPMYTSQLDVFERAAGNRLGHLVASASPAEGSVLVLQWQGMKERAKDNVEAQLEGLQAGLADSALKVVVRGPEFPEGDDSLMQLLLGGAPISEKQLAEWITETGDVVAIVAFLEVRTLMNPRKLKELPPVYLKGLSESPRVVALVDRGFLKAAVVDKSDINVSKQPPKGLSVEELFDLRFRLLTGSSSARAVTRFDANASRVLYARAATRPHQNQRTGNDQP